MKTLIANVGIAVICLCIGYTVGAYRSARHISVASHAAGLVWLTGIHQGIANADYERAKAITESAVDGHVRVLAQVENDPASLVISVIPWAPDPMGQVTPGALKKAHDYFAAKTSALKPETREYLASTQETGD